MQRTGSDCLASVARRLRVRDRLYDPRRDLPAHTPLGLQLLPGLRVLTSGPLLDSMAEVKGSFDDVLEISERTRILKSREQAIACIEIAYFG